MLLCNLLQGDTIFFLFFWFDVGISVVVVTLVTPMCPSIFAIWYFFHRDHWTTVYFYQFQILLESPYVGNQNACNNKTKCKKRVMEMGTSCKKNTIKSVAIFYENYQRICRNFNIEITVESLANLLQNF